MGKPVRSICHSPSRSHCIVIRGREISLRTIRQQDLERFFELESEVAYRGDYVPNILRTESELLRRYNQDGFWGDESGTLLIVKNDDDQIIGHIVFFKPNLHFNGFEIGYYIYEASDRGKGHGTEALDLFVNYLFRSKNISRLQVMIHPENRPSLRTAAKAGFKFEGTLRDVVLVRGATESMECHSITRSDHDERSTS